MKNIKLKYIISGLLGLFLIWFLFRTTELTISFDGVEKTAETMMTYGSFGNYRKSRDTMEFAKSMNDSLSVANMLDTSSVYEESSEIYEIPERYRENLYYRVDTEKFDNLLTNITKVIEEYNGTIKINEQNSNRKKEYDKEFYPRYQILEFTINNDKEDLSKIEETLKEFGNIRISNTSKTSIEQEIANNKDRLKEIEAARKALQESKDKDWIARQDANYAKESERIKNQIENAEKQSTYKTYTINIYEVIKFRINSIRYWYHNNYQLQDAISNSLPDMIELFAKLIPITLMLLLFIYFFNIIQKNDKNKTFKSKLDMIKNLDLDKNIHFDIKM